MLMFNRIENSMNKKIVHQQIYMQGCAVQFSIFLPANRDVAGTIYHRKEAVHVK